MSYYYPYNYIKVKIRKYYTFGEVMSQVRGSQAIPNSFTAFQQYLTNNNDVIASSTTFNNLFEEVFNLLIDEYSTWAITYVDYLPDPNQEEPTLTDEEVLDACLKILTRYIQTYDKYVVLLGFYQAQKSNLLEQVQSMTKQLYNDTPQNGGNFDDDNHLSSISSTQSATDADTIMGRLNEIQKTYRQLVKDWMDEFSGIFIPLKEGDE